MGTAPRIRYAPGARLVIRDEEWIVRRVEETEHSGSALFVSGLSELVRGKDAIFLDRIEDDIVQLDPRETQLVEDPSSGFLRSKLFLESLLRRAPTHGSALSIGHRGAMIPQDYQLVPAHMALGRPRARILIADAVGLGKTLEVGVLLSELIRRGRGRRILVVALKSILEQFQHELWGRFTIPLVRLDSVGIQRVRRNIPANMNPFHFYDRVIVSIDTLKKDQKYRRFLEDAEWDAIVVDECQHVAVRGKSSRGSQRAELAKLLATRTDTLILTSATPHDGKKESFASLVELLDPTAIADAESYTADDLRGLDLFVRRFKKDIKGGFKKRVVHPHNVDASEEERALLAALREVEFQTIGRGKSRGVLFRTLLLKSFLSSPEALIETLDNRADKLARSTRDADAVAHDQAAIASLLFLARKVRAQSKLTRLDDLLKELKIGKSDTRVVIFSERIVTLQQLKTHLVKKLKLKSKAVDIFTGTLEDQKQHQIVKDFGTEGSDLRVLLCSDAAAEGLNLHHQCHQLVHFDIPWSLMTLEQRNGRIDRYGQEHAPQIHYLLQRFPGDDEEGQHQADLRILALLIEREKQAHENLGDVRWLMKLFSADAEEERVAQAIEQGEIPEEVLPEPTAEVSEDDFLTAFFSAPAEPAGVPTRAPLSLYPNDFDYYEDAMRTLAGQDELRAIAMPEIDRERGTIALPVSEDLRQRFRRLPPRLRPKEKEPLLLTTKRERVMAAIDEARRDGSFPAWHLLWDIHPVAEWASDRLLSHFARGEAPVVRAAVHDDEAVFVVHGVLSNRQSQPVVSRWMAIRTRAEALGAVEDFEAFANEIALTKSLINTGATIDVARLAPLRAPVVEAAIAHMAKARDARGKQLGPDIKRDMKRVKAWRDKRVEVIGARRTQLEKKGTLRADLEKKLGEQERRVARRFEDTQRFVQNLATDEQPYLRVAAVIVGCGYEQ